MVYIDPSFQRLFHKNTTGRLHFLNKLRFQLDTKAAVAIYKLLIIPVLTYCSVLSSFGNKSRADRINSVDSRATRIVNRHADQAHAVTLPSIASIKKKHARTFARKCIDAKLCEHLAEYFSLLNHKNNSISLNLLSVRIEFSRRSVYFQVLSSLTSYLYKFDNENFLKLF